jgi:hypothetical protein
VPIYDAIVYVPNAPVDPLSHGASCDGCALSGKPLVATITDAVGHFSLGNMPVGPAVPLVVQVGKWRRQLTIANVPECVDTPLDPATTRLPRSQSEGELPRVAISTGSGDTVECLLRKLGVDEAEFTTAAGPGAIHLYTGEANGAVQITHSFADGGATFPEAGAALWDDVAHLKPYDLVILSCETARIPNPPPALKAMKDYVDLGGRVLLEHFHDFWIDTDAGAPFDPVAKFNEQQGTPLSPQPVMIETTYPKGAALSEFVYATTDAAADATPGRFSLYQARNVVESVDRSKATPWLDIVDFTGDAGPIQQFTFNTPQGAPEGSQCGRVLYSALHASVSNPAGLPFPTGCMNNDLAIQEKELAFMLFDLGACIISDKVAPKPPLP